MQKKVNKAEKSLEKSCEMQRSSNFYPLTHMICVQSESFLFNMENHVGVSSVQ